MTSTRATSILLISGSLRSGSTNGAVLEAAQTLAPDDVETVTYDGVATLPHFNPDDDVEPLHPAVADLRRRLGEADAVLFSTPEYAGALPGSLKNMLDWTVGDAVSSGMPIGWVNASATGGAAGAHRELRIVVEYTDWTVVDAACVNVPVARSDIGADGRIDNPAQRDGIAAALSALVVAVNDRRSRPG